MYKYSMRSRTTLSAPPKLETRVSIHQASIPPELTLKVACRFVGVTSECNLGLPPIQNIHNLPVRNIAHLVVLVDDLSILVADSSLLLVARHQGVTCFVRRTNVAVDSSPPIFTFAGIAFS